MPRKSLSVRCWLRVQAELGMRRAPRLEKGGDVVRPEQTGHLNADQVTGPVDFEGEACVHARPLTRVRLPNY